MTQRELIAHPAPSGSGSAQEHGSTRRHLLALLVGCAGMGLCALVPPDRPPADDTIDGGKP